MTRCAMLLLLLLFLCPFSPAQLPRVTSPKQEVRAVWIATAAGLDWPRSLDRREQQEELRTMIRRLKDAGFNTIFFQARARGDAYYSSPYEPWAENLTGTLGKDPGWDPLQFAIDEAHAVGMELHAWFNLYKVRGPTPVRQSTPLHPSLAFPHWIVEVDGEAWIDPGNPAGRNYLLTVALDLVTSYSVDGINFDFIRYPSRDFPDGNNYARFGTGMKRDDWRRSSITLFVKEFYERASRLRPMLKIGSSPLGVYDGEPGSSQAGSYHDRYQDAPGWIRAGTHDYVAPQIYWNIGSSRGDPDFAYLARQWVTLSGRRHVYTGIAAYKPDVARELPQQIDIARRAGAAGQAIYRYQHVPSPEQLGGRYTTPALIPPMPWKDSIPPLPPSSLATTEAGTNVFHLEWKPPVAASDSDTGVQYVLYRSTAPAIAFSDPASIVAVTGLGRTHWIDTIRVPSGLTYFYAVTALDKGNNESAPSTIASAVPRELLALQRKIAEVTSLSTSISTADGTPSVVAYRLSQRTPLTLSVHRRFNREADSVVAVLVRKEQDPGTYVVGLGGVRFTEGEYVLRLRAGSRTLEQPVTVRRSQ